MEEAWKIFEEAGESMGLGDCYTYKGTIEQHYGRAEAAAEHYDKAVEIFKECRNDKKRLNALRHKGTLLMQMGQLSEALALLNDVVAQAGKLESDFESAKCWFQRYQVLMAMGLWDEANISIERAEAYIKKVDDCRWTGIIRAGRL